MISSEFARISSCSAGFHYCFSFKLDKISCFCCSFGAYTLFEQPVIYFLAKELKEGYLAGENGTYKDPEGYFVCQNLPKEFEEFDKRF